MRSTPPVTTCYTGYSRAVIQFDHLTDARYSTSTSVPGCNSPIDPFNFSVNLYPGSYRVTVRRGTYGSVSGLPSLGRPRGCIDTTRDETTPIPPPDIKPAAASASRSSAEFPRAPGEIPA